MMANPLGWEHTTGHSDHDRDILDLLGDDQDIVAFANTESDAAPIETYVRQITLTLRFPSIIVII